MAYACIYTFNLDFNKIKKNEFDLFDNLLKMPMLLCKGLTSYQQLWSYGDWASVIQKTGEVQDRMHDPWFTRIVAFSLRHGSF